MQITVARGQQELGVFSLEEIRAGLTSGQLQPTDYGWTEGQTDWIPLASFPGLAVVAAVPPPLSHAAASGAVPMLPAAGAAASLARPVPTSGAAIASLICGILSFFLPVLLSLPAIICGHIARSNARNGAMKGAGMALAGLIMGYITFAIMPVAILAGIALPVFNEVQTRGLETKALSNAKQIATACRLYAVDNDGRYPKILDELVPDYLPDRSLFVFPFTPSDPMGYEYYGSGGKDTDPNPETRVFLASKTLSKGKRRIVVYGDTSGRVVRDMPQLPPHGQ